MLTEKDYCNLEITDELRKLGYPKWPYEAMDMDSRLRIIPLYNAQKWLREEKGIHVEVYACAGGYIYELCKAYKPNSFSGGTTIYTPNDIDNPKLNDAGRYDDFEICLSEGIKEAVKILGENK